MSMEIYVLSDKQLGSMNAWQQAVDAEHFALKLNTERPIGELQGFLPAAWGGRQAGFECDPWSPSDVIDTYTEVAFNRPWKYCLAFRWGADARACLGAYMAAAAYASATAGVVFDPDSGRILAQLLAKQMAQQIEKDLPSHERMMESIVNRIASTGRIPP
jgi:hypothetical protein